MNLNAFPCGVLQHICFFFFRSYVRSGGFTRRCSILSLAPTSTVTLFEFSACIVSYNDMKMFLSPTSDHFRDVTP